MRCFLCGRHRWQFFSRNYFDREALWIPDLLITRSLFTSNNNGFEPPLKYLPRSSQSLLGRSHFLSSHARKLCNIKDSYLLGTLLPICSRSLRRSREIRTVKVCSQIWRNDQMTTFKLRPTKPKHTNQRITTHMTLSSQPSYLLPKSNSKSRQISEHDEIRFKCHSWWPSLDSLPNKTPTQPHPHRFHLIGACGNNWHYDTMMWWLVPTLRNQSIFTELSMQSSGKKVAWSARA